VNEKLVLAYSGGLDTSVMVHWLEEKYDYDIVTLTADVGQASDLIEAEKTSKLVGAIMHYTVYAKNEFLEDYVYLAIKANALYESNTHIADKFTNLQRLALIRSSD